MRRESTMKRPSPRRSQQGARAPRPASKEIKIGIRLKHARRVKGFSLRQLADQVGCSESFISKIENDKVRPSFSVLHRIVTSLEMNVASLFEDNGSQPDQVCIMRPNKRPVIRVDPVWKGEGIMLERLVPSAPGTLLQANIHHIDAGANTDGPIQHEGDEFGYVLEGKLKLVVENVSYLIGPGESFSFRSHLPHSYSNPGKSTTKVLWVNTPPTF